MSGAIIPAILWAVAFAWTAHAIALALPIAHEVPW